ncbi:MAG: sulfatase-like hydrolase/transferase [Cyclobacteriaceae bacterium]|nr:sulfatase-like hydrolase/transferase [Cyclobacteriaceae bacterium]
MINRLFLLTVACASICSFHLLANHTSIPESDVSDKPNFLWITCEDISPYLGSYGFKQAHTPHLDKLAKQGIRFTQAYANAPVCAVARATLLSGMFAPTTGTHQMRSYIHLPEAIPAYPKIFREAGYYCTNNVKKDYNSTFEQDTSLWDESSNQAHFKNRKTGQPFFAVFNNFVTHESQLSEDRIDYYVKNRLITETPRIDPADIILPPYHPDLPEIRYDWARFHDLITLMDQMTGDLLQELEDSGEADNTIIFFYSDHGGMLSRSKRYIYNVGMQVPFIVYLPEKWQHLSAVAPGNSDDRLVSFVDFAKTVVAMAGLDVPQEMQGYAFLGSDIEASPETVFLYRDRMAERYDLSRAVTDGRYYFIRNFMPHRPLGRDSRYGFSVQANWNAWEQHFDAGLCDEIQSQFFKPKAPIELFDTEKDPWHVQAITDNADQSVRIQKMSDALDRHIIQSRDLGLIPEPMFHQLIGSDKKHATLYEYAQSDDYPIASILAAAKDCSSRNTDLLDNYLQYCRDTNPVIRFWGLYAIFLNGFSDEQTLKTLRNAATSDQISANRIMAAQALGRCGDQETSFSALMKETMKAENTYLKLQALNAFQYAQVDQKLKKSDWEFFKSKEWPKDDRSAQLGYPLRIISDALQLWPDRRIID